MSLDTGDATELAELLQFLSDWLASDTSRLGTSLREFIGNPAYNTPQLRTDLDRFAFLPRGNDGEPLFHAPPGEPRG